MSLLIGGRLRSYLPVPVRAGLIELFLSTVALPLPSKLSDI